MSYFWIEFVIIFLISLLVSGYQVYVANQALQIPLVQSLHDPTLFPHDPFVGTLDHYIGPVWRIISFLINFFPLETVLLLLFLFTRGLILFAAARLALAFYPGSNLAAVGAMSFFALAPTPILGHGTLVNNYFEHTSFSIALLLLAAAAFYLFHPYEWAILLAVGINLNAMYGMYACSYFAVVFVLDKRYRNNWKSWLAPVLLFLLFTTPTILAAISALRIEAIDNDLWLQLAEIRFSHHLYPLSWNQFQYNLLLAYIAAYLVLLISIRIDLRKFFWHGIIWLVIGLIWLLLAFMAAYVIKSPALLTLHPARGMDLWFAYASVAIIAALVYRIQSDPSNKRLFFVLFVFSICWFWFVETTFFMEWVILFIVLLVIWESAWNHLLRNGDPERLVGLVLLVVIFLGTFPFLVNFYKYRVITVVGYPGSQVRELANWARTNTSKEEVFLIDPNWSDFRALSERPVFVTWKDGSAILWERSYANEWAKRIESFNFNFQKTDERGAPDGFQPLSQNFEELDDDQITNMIREFNLSYWIVQDDHDSSFPVAFQTRDYKVLDLQN